MPGPEFCPLCSRNGARVRVKAFQLNLQEAVFMCSAQKVRLARRGLFTGGRATSRRGF